MKFKLLSLFILIILAMSAYFAYVSLDNKLFVLEKKSEELNQKSKQLFSSIHCILDNIKILPEIQTSNIPKPKQFRDLEKYPLPAMYLQFLEKKGKKIREDLIIEAKRIKQDIPNIYILMPPLKSASDKGLNRVKEKTVEDYSGDLKKMKDIVRGSLVFQNLTELKKGFRLFKNSNDFKVEYVNNRFDDPTEGGYRDLVIFIRHKESNILAELQFHLCPIINAKKMEHSSYKKVRSIEGVAKAQQRDLTNEEKAIIESSLEKSKNIYNAAYLEALSGGRCMLQSNKYLV